MEENNEIMTETSEETIESSSPETEAKEKGWIPPEEAVKRGMDPKEAVDAKTFLDREPFIQRIKLLDQRNRTMAQKVDRMLSKFDEAEMQGYQRAIAELENQKDIANEEMDSKKAREIDAAIHEQTRNLEEAQNRQQQSKMDDFPEAAEFVSRNAAWWQKDMQATQYAAILEQKIMAEQPGIDPTEMYNQIQASVDEFRGVQSETPRPKASYVAPPTRASGNAGEATSYDFNDLTSEAKDVYMSMRQYRKDEFGDKYTIDQFIKAQTEHGLVSIEELVKK
jgi:hypothetical protein